MVIQEKSVKLEKAIEVIKNVDPFEYTNLVASVTTSGEAEVHLLKCLQVFVTLNAENKFNRLDINQLFL